MFRPIRSSPAHHLLRRRVVKYFSQKVTPKTSQEDIPSGSRPTPWVYSTSVGLRLVLIPSGLLYAVFFADFGDREHVFMPPRRWLQRQRDAFFSITPEERRLVEESSTSQIREQNLAGAPSEE